MNAAFRRLWGWPLLLGLVTAIGLISALVGDGAYDMLSWLGLGMPVAVSLWCAGRKKPASHEASLKRRAAKKG